MPPPSPQSGPYAPQPQGPYGTPPPGAPAPGPYGYGAQQSWPQQQYPQQGFPQQPFGQQQGWGMPPMGPPAPRKNRAGLVIGIIAVVLVVLGGLGFAVSRLAGVTGDFPEAKYLLAVPQTLLNGQYTLTQDMSERGRESLKGASQAEIRDPQSAVGQYSGAKDGTSIVLSGIYGRVKAPERQRASMLRGARGADGVTIVTPPRDATPAGSDVKIFCQVLTKSQGALSVTFPMCAWGDSNTVASLGVVSPASAGQKPADVDVDEAAELTAKVRAEVRRPIGSASTYSP